MSYPTPYKVGWHVRSAGGADRFRDVITYNPAKDQPGTPVAVIGWAPARSATSNDGRQLPGYDRAIIDVQLFVPPTFTPGRGDLIDLPDAQYEVAENPEDWNRGFHQWAPGNVINLRRIEG